MTGLWLSFVPFVSFVVQKPFDLRDDSTKAPQSIMRFSYGSRSAPPAGDCKGSRGID